MGSGQETTPSNELMINCAALRRQLKRGLMLKRFSRAQRRDGNSEKGRRELKWELLG